MRLSKVILAVLVAALLADAQPVRIGSGKEPATTSKKNTNGGAETSTEKPTPTNANDTGAKKPTGDNSSKGAKPTAANDAVASTSVDKPTVDNSSKDPKGSDSKATSTDAKPTDVSSSGLDKPVVWPPPQSTASSEAAVWPPKPTSTAVWPPPKPSDITANGSPSLKPGSAPGSPPSKPALPNVGAGVKPGVAATKPPGPAATPVTNGNVTRPAAVVPRPRPIPIPIPASSGNGTEAPVSQDPEDSPSSAPSADAPLDTPAQDTPVDNVTPPIVEVASPGSLPGPMASFDVPPPFVPTPGDLEGNNCFPVDFSPVVYMCESYAALPDDQICVVLPEDFAQVNVGGNTYIKSKQWQLGEACSGLPIPESPVANMSVPRPPPVTMGVTTFTATDIPTETVVPEDTTTEAVNNNTVPSNPLPIKPLPNAPALAPAPAGVPTRPIATPGPPAAVRPPVAAPAAVRPPGRPSAVVPGAPGVWSMSKPVSTKPTVVDVPVRPAAAAPAKPAAAAPAKPATATTDTAAPTSNKKPSGASVDKPVDTPTADNTDTTWPPKPKPNTAATADTGSGTDSVWPPKPKPAAASVDTSSATTDSVVPSKPAAGNKPSASDKPTTTDKPSANDKPTTADKPSEDKPVVQSVGTKPGAKGAAKKARQASSSSSSKDPKATASKADKTTESTSTSTGKADSTSKPSATDKATGNDKPSANDKPTSTDKPTVDSTDKPSVIKVPAGTSSTPPKPGIKPGSAQDTATQEDASSTWPPKPNSAKPATAQDSTTAQDITSTWPPKPNSAAKPAASEDTSATWPPKPSTADPPTMEDSSSTWPPRPVTGSTSAAAGKPVNGTAPASRPVGRPPVIAVGGAGVAPVRPQAAPAAVRPAAAPAAPKPGEANSTSIPVQAADVINAPAPAPVVAAPAPVTRPPPESITTTTATEPPPPPPPKLPPSYIGHKCVVVPKGRVPESDTCPSKPIPLAPPVVSSWYVTMGGLRYAVIDFTKTNDDITPCTTWDLRKLPAGWTLADNTPYARLAIQSRLWGASYVVLKDGKAYQTMTNYSVPLTDMLGGDEITGYTVGQCPMNILIQQPAPENSRENLVTDPTVAITNLITFNGTQYASLDDVLPNSTVIGCQEDVRVLPEGWTVADQNLQMRIALMGGGLPFGTLCGVTAGGRSFQMSDGSDCGPKAYWEYSVPDQAGKNMTAYFTNGCMRRILIQRPAPPGTANTWEYKPVMSNFAVVGTYVYATIDNIDPSATSQGCSNRATMLQDGWEFADPNIWTTRELLKNGSRTNFGSWCLVMQDGVGYKTDGSFGVCGQDLLEIDEKFMVRMWTMKPVTCQGSIAECSGPVSYEGSSPPSNVALAPNTTWTSYDQEVVHRFFTVKYCNKRILVQKKVTPFKLAMGVQKALVLTPDQEAFHLKYAKKILDSKSSGGYDVIETKTTSSFPLVNDDGTPKYYAIIQTDAFLSTQLADGTWVSSLSQEMWSRIDHYSARFGVRRVSIFTYPTPLLGVDIEPQDPFPGEDTIYMARSSQAPTSFELATQPMIRKYVYSVPSKIIINKRRTADEGVTVIPVLSFKGGKDDVVANESDNVAGIIRQTANGARTMHFFFASSTDVTHGKPFGDAWFTWCTEGVDPPESGGLSTGLIVFIGIAAAIVGLLIMYCLLRYCCNRCDKEKWLDMYYDKFGE